MRQRLLAAVVFGAVALPACVAVGPKTVPRDRFEYSASITESWKRQTLLNIVKLRYLDPPIFVDVGQIIGSYSLETVVNAGGSISSPGAVQGDTLALGGAARFIDRPTITYTPLTGNRFVKSLMTPLPPEAVFFTIQAGWPADAVLFATTSSINGLKNQYQSITGFTGADPDFMRVLGLLRKIQLSGAVGFRVVQGKEGQDSAIVTLRSTEVPPEVLDDIKTLRRLLRLNPGEAELKLTFSAVAASDHELAVITRSLLQIMQTMAGEVDVPPEHLTEGRAAPGRESANADESEPRLVRVHNSREQPGDAFVAVPYRDRWFWVDDRDLKSKRSLAFMMMLFTLADTGEKEPLPLITIPAQ